MSWRVAKSLLALKSQINKIAPNRNTGSDGTIGDERHRKQGSRSDHNPWVGGNVVTALDITHDKLNGCDCHQIVKELVKNRDPRIKYIIWQGRIISSVVSPWVWRTSKGHFNHFHLSVKSSKQHYDDDSNWKIDGVNPTVLLPGATHQVIARSGLRLRSGPGLNFSVHKVLHNGTQVILRSVQGDWIGIDIEGDGSIDGFVHGSFLSKL